MDKTSNITEGNYPAARGIARIIKEKGMKQVYVAEKAGYTAGEMSSMLNGRKLIKACDIMKIALALDVTADDIYAAGEKADERGGVGDENEKRKRTAP